MRTNDLNETYHIKNNMNIICAWAYFSAFVPCPIPESSCQVK